jgi:hypothetical protein
LGWEASETTLGLIPENADNNPGKRMRLLQQCYRIARSEDKDKINPDFPSSQ